MTKSADPTLCGYAHDLPVKLVSARPGSVPICPECDTMKCGQCGRPVFDIFTGRCSCGGAIGLRVP